jgi:molecular chaperone GrpE
MQADDNTQENLPQINNDATGAEQAAPRQDGESHPQASTEASDSNQTAGIAALQAEAEKHRDAWLRAVADADNIRKRAEERVASAHKFAIDNFSTELLSVKDSLEAALAVDNATVESYRNGVELTLKQLANVFSKFNVAEINPVGEKFDPHRHQAINMVQSEAEPNSVVMVLQKGYTLNDRVLRPALVTVAKAKAKG